MKTSAEVQESASAQNKTVDTGQFNNESDQPITGWKFHAEGLAKTKSNLEGEITSKAKSSKSNIETVTWTASEYIAHQKSVVWYLVLILVAGALSTGIYFLTKDTISVVVIIIVTLIFGIYAARKPRVLNYRLDESGLAIGSKSYPYDLFKSFSLVNEGAFTSIMLMPLKRFMPAVSIYFEPKDEDKITVVLAERLPVENHKLDAIDNLMRRIRF